MAKTSKNSKVSKTNLSNLEDFSFERSIGQLTNVIQNLSNKLDKNPPTPQNPPKPPKPPKPSKPTVETPDMSDFENALGDVGQKIFSGIDSIFGRRTSKKLKEKIFDGVTGKNNPISGVGKKLLGGGVDAAGGGMASFAGGALKALGAVTAVIDITKKLFDFINSGEAAQAAAEFGQIFNVDTSKLTRELFKQSKEYRKLIADYNILEPINQANQLRMDGLEHAKSVEMDEVQWRQSVVKDSYDYQMGLERDKITFANDQAAQSLDANMARNKTLFTNSMGYMRGAIGVSERALMAIGSSTQAVLDTVKEVGVGLGTSLKNQVAMATSAQGLGVLFGSTADDVLKMSKTFRLMDKSTARQALNMVAGVKAFAKLNGMSPAQLHKEMADSQEEIFKYTNYTSMEYAKQVVQLKNMNTSMSSMMKASDAMVLNYKDSMKAEMSLGAMIGQNVDLSETRALLMSGKTSEAASAMKSALSGIDIGALNPFAKQELTQATGMNIDEIMNLMSGKEMKSKGQLEAENAAKTGAAIANGALKQDVANAAAKLALEQSQRKKLLEFEQIVRKNSLMIEQSQRLQNLAIEQKYRLKFAKATKDSEIDAIIGKMQAEAASGFFANIMGKQKGLQMENIKGVGDMSAQDVKSTLNKERELINKLSASKVIKADDQRLADYAAQFSRFEMSKNLKDMPKAMEYFGEQLKERKVEVKENVRTTAKTKIKADKKSEGFGGWMDELASRLAASGGIAVGVPGMGNVSGQTYKEKAASMAAAEQRIKDSQAAKIAKEEADRDYKIAKADAANLGAIDKALGLETQKINGLKEQSSKDNLLFYKQNELMLKYQGQTNDFMKALLQTGQTPITIDGKVLNKSLLNVNQKQYGLGGINN